MLSALGGASLGELELELGPAFAKARVGVGRAILLVVAAGVGGTDMDVLSVVRSQKSGGSSYSRALVVIGAISLLERDTNRENPRGLRASDLQTRPANRDTRSREAHLFQLLQRYLGAQQISSVPSPPALVKL